MFDLMPQPDVMSQSPCWEWSGKKTTQGYGHTGRTFAHRASFEAFVEPIPEGLTIDHLCRNRLCVNPEHLEPVTRIENVLRGESPHALNARRVFCVNGHEFTPENTYTHKAGAKRGRRQCRECLRRRSRTYYYRQKEAANV